MNIRKTRLVERETLKLLLQAALQTGELRFARQAVFAWLAAFPGDLEMRLLQARVIFAGEHPAQAIPILEQIINRDPEYLDAQEFLMRVYRNHDTENYKLAATFYMVLSGKAGSGNPIRGGNGMRAAYRALEEQNWDELGKLLPTALSAFPASALGGVIHIRYAQAVKDRREVLRLAEQYHQKWPDCQAFQLVMAVCQIDMEREEAGVGLLHQCVNNDAMGQVARRLWGNNHPYITLWPESMVIPFDFPVPAQVAGRMGWNQLDAGVNKNNVSTTMQSQSPGVRSPVQDLEPSNPPELTKPAENDSSEVASILSAPKPVNGICIADLKDAAQGSVPTEKEPDPNLDQTAGGNGAVMRGALKDVELEFERLAKRIRRPTLAREDGRYPVYVIFTTRNGLINQYGVQTTAVLDQEMRKLAGLIRQRPGWESHIIYADDTACLEKFALLPAPHDDPWKLKLLLRDLDQALAKRGEMIGAVLIVGGDSVVPFHQLPNPTDDVDRVVPSDSPYSTLDSNYFISDWPVGRLPGEPGPDVAFLLERIRKLQKYHGWVVEKGRVQTGWFRWLKRLLHKRESSRRYHGVGYTAAVWRRSSMAVYRPIGQPHTLLTSPPEDSSSIEPQQLTSAGLGYYNLHGVEDSEVWYGQSDPTESYNGPDYPVALSPKDLRRNGKAPKVVFSEACYGGHIFDKTENQSLALKFLGVGTLAVVASTCIAYGSISTPLIAADLLGSLFWKHLKAGRTAGEALLQARVDLACEMNRRQGYLDAEDQKALISFVLYGDPLAAYTGFLTQNKGTSRLKDHAPVKTVQEQEVSEVQGISGEVLKQAKILAAEYLPGVDLSNPDGLELTLRKQNKTGQSDNSTDKNIRRKSGKQVDGRLVVTVSKHIQVAHHIHRHYVRVTLDEAGKPVKLSVSR